MSFGRAALFVAWKQSGRRYSISGQQRTSRSADGKPASDCVQALNHRRRTSAGVDEAERRQRLSQRLAEDERRSALDFFVRALCCHALATHERGPVTSSDATFSVTASDPASSPSAASASTRQGMRRLHAGERACPENREMDSIEEIIAAAVECCPDTRPVWSGA